MTQAPDSTMTAPAPSGRRWDSPAARKAGDVSAHARLYLRMMAQSDYVARLAHYEIGRASCRERV